MSFSDITEAIRNLTNTGLKGYKCNRCNKHYAQYSSLWRHNKYECGVLPQFPCPYCSHSSKRKFNLKAHIINVHPEQAV